MLAKWWHTEYKTRVREEARKEMERVAVVRSALEKPDRNKLPSRQPKIKLK